MNELKSGIADAMYKIAIDDLNNSSLKGGPLESMAILDSLNYSHDRYKKYLEENKIKFNISDTEVDKIIKECHTIVYEHFFGKEE